MNSDNSGSVARIAGHPILRVLVSFPIACFSGALLTDIAYARTADMIWADFSAWLLAVGIVMGLVAAIGGLVSLVASRRPPVRQPVWPIAIGGAYVLALALLDNLVHSRDAWTSVVPFGLALSAILVVTMLVTVWFGSGTSIRRNMDMQFSRVRQ